MFVGLIAGRLIAKPVRQFAIEATVRSTIHPLIGRTEHFESCNTCISQLSVKSSLRAHRVYTLSFGFTGSANGSTALRSSSSPSSSKLALDLPSPVLVPPIVSFISQLPTLSCPPTTDPPTCSSADVSLPTTTAPAFPAPLPPLTSTSRSGAIFAVP